MNDTPAKTILIVEDDQDVLAILRIVLKSGFRNCQILTAAQGRDALEILTQQPIDLMLTDFNMPNMNGVDLTKRAKAINPQLRVALITAYTTAEIRTEAQAAGVDFFMNKPFGFDQIESLISKML
jgi:CheY-like chemotaxis protein